MENKLTLQNWQFRGGSGAASFDLPVFEAVIQTYRRIVTEAGRLINNLNKFMSVVRAVVIGVSNLSNGDSYAGTVSVQFVDDNDLSVETKMFDVTDANTHSNAEFISNLVSQILSYASGHSYSITSNDIIFTGVSISPRGLVNAPQAAISDAPADAVTNYNTVTTLLGALTGAVNTANSKQNDIATKLNTLLAELRTLNLISS